jgi:dipeptidyl aminopeptidase/acylaminoacyl peptidase
LYVGALDGRKPKRVLNDARAGRYVQSGHVLFLRGQTLLAQEFDSDALEARGDAVPIAENVGLGAALGAGFSASTTGTVVYRPIQDDPTQLFWFGRDGSRHAPVGPAGSYRNAVLSPSGRQVALARRDPATGNFDIYALDITTGVLSRQTDSPAFEHDPVWSPDERTLAFGSDRTTWMRAYRKDLSTGSEALLADLDAEYVSPKDWTLDGRLVVLQTPKAIYAVSADGTAKPRRLTTTASILVQLHVSPEGKLIAFGSSESGRWEVYVASFPDFTDKRQVSIDGGVQPLWRRDGRVLFFLTFEGALMSVPIGVNGIPAAPQRLFEATPHGVCCFTEYGVTADGQRFLFMERKAQTITILMNWLDSRETN